MRLSSQEEYGLRCLIRVGREGTEASVTIPELARSEGISQPHAAKMLRLLRRGGFVKSTRGQSGGYTLARPADQIAVGHVLAVLGGRLFDANFCGTHAGAESLCTHMGDCAIRSVWRTIQEAIDGVLARLTLKDVLVSEQQMNIWASARPSLPTYTHNA
jgi:Rrf2 family transcriptional regulator, iron-sulfur cluster assembly transcription factor